MLEAEIRQMLEARNARREARGEAPLDVDAEYRALADPVCARRCARAWRPTNARRVARGQEPLDVEAEVDRRLRDLG